MSVPVSYSSAGLYNPELIPCHAPVSESGYLTDSWFPSDPGSEPESVLAPVSDPEPGAGLVSRFDFDSDYRSVLSWLHLSSVPLPLIKLSFSSSKIFVINKIQ